jgi:hypothetical protein
MRSANGEGYEQIQRCPSKILSTRLNRVKGVYKRKCLRFTDKAVTVGIYENSSSGMVYID